MKVSLIAENENGANGAIYIDPIFCKLHILTSINTTPKVIPYSPNVPANMIKINLKIVTASYNDGTTKADIAVSPTTSSIGAPISPAVTAASPMTNAPTMLIA